MPPDMLAHIAALEADNAALLQAVRSAQLRWAAHDQWATIETLREEAEKPHPGAALLERHAKEVAALRAFADGFAATAEGAVRHQETKGAGGQQVSYHDHFACIPPSVTGQLRWWARAGREALEGKVSGLLVRARNEGLEKAARYHEQEAAALRKNIKWLPANSTEAEIHESNAVAIRAMKEPEQ